MSNQQMSEYHDTIGFVGSTLPRMASTNPGWIAMRVVFAYRPRCGNCFIPTFFAEMPSTLRKPSASAWS